MYHKFIFIKMMPPTLEDEVGKVAEVADILGNSHKTCLRDIQEVQVHCKQTHRCKQEKIENIYPMSKYFY